jgi:hypothetical protein
MNRTRSLLIKEMKKALVNVFDEMKVAYPDASNRNL